MEHEQYKLMASAFNALLVDSLDKEEGVSDTEVQRTRDDSNRISSVGTADDSCDVLTHSEAETDHVYQCYVMEDRYSVGSSCGVRDVGHPSSDENDTKSDIVLMRNALEESSTSDVDCVSVSSSGSSLFRAQRVSNPPSSVSDASCFSFSSSPARTSENAASVALHPCENTAVLSDVEEQYGAGRDNVNHLGFPINQTTKASQSQSETQQSLTLSSFLFPDAPESPCVPPSSYGPRSKLPTIEEYQKELFHLSRSAWGTSGPNALELMRETTASVDALRTGSLEVLAQYTSPFSSTRQNPRKRKTIAAVLPDAKRVPYLDKRTLSITYKNTLESDRVLARNLGGWDTFLTIKGQLASIDRDFLEQLLLETCCTEPRLVSKIADCCAKTTDRNFLLPRSTH